MTWLRRLLTDWWCVGLVFVAWYVATAIPIVRPQVIPSPITVVGALAESPLDFLLPAGHTLLTAGAGFVIGVAFGYLMAAMTWLTPTLNGLLLPFALILRSVPFVALVPVLARMFGYGVPSALAICALVCFFPTFVLVSSGLRELPPNSDELFRALGARRIERFVRLAVPAAMPSLGTAIRISSGTSILAALVAEFIMGTEGLARVLIDALGLLRIDRLWAASVVAIILSVAAYVVASVVEDRLAKNWRP